MYPACFKDTGGLRQWFPIKYLGKISRATPPEADLKLPRLGQVHQGGAEIVGEIPHRATKQDRIECTIQESFKTHLLLFFFRRTDGNLYFLDIP